ncbi:laccase 2 [Chaetomium strumarium]|uniref:Laccase 2 n=1 Tax=Chaetomium strumarium TaxID=1170767 RepID=A0AAJ0GWI4_9PEZI|nr:laccase 2 [Chaetomium strumarium]
MKAISAVRQAAWLYAIVAAAVVAQEEPPCAHSADTRRCWGNYSIDTNYYEVVPDTGVTREFWFVVENVTMAPDGYEQPVIVVNRSIPGPTIEVDWGDQVVVHVTNLLENNGTSIHWHGIRMRNNYGMDGVPGVSQCPIPPGGTFTYRWRAEQYGTTWYHSHFSMQYSVGLQGPIVIHGPATANYDEDLGTVVLQDWSHVSPFAMWWYSRLPSGPPPLANALINGKNVFDCTSSADPDDKNCIGNGTRAEWSFQQGKRYRMRIINTGLYSNFRFSIDDHNLTVIAADLVPIEPYVTDNIAITMGQRYDVIVQANRPVGDYWLRAIWQTSCCPNDAVNNTLGIIRYDSTSTADPNTTNPAVDYPDNCGDEDAENLVPWLKLDVGPPLSTDVFYLDDVTLPDPKGFLWTLNGTYLWANFSAPTNLLLADADKTAFPADYMVYRTPATASGWVYIAFNDISNRNRSHPMHLHGHDFYVLATGPGNFTSSSSSSSSNNNNNNNNHNNTAPQLQLANPRRRDTATWPARGYMVLAYKTNNPGTWLLHCHIAWHSSEALGLQMLERPGDMDLSAGGQVAGMRQLCGEWERWLSNHGDAIVQEDAGI